MDPLYLLYYIDNWTRDPETIPLEVKLDCQHHSLWDGVRISIPDTIL